MIFASSEVELYHGNVSERMSDNLLVLIQILEYTDLDCRLNKVGLVVEKYAGDPSRVNLHLTSGLEVPGSRL